MHRLTQHLIWREVELDEVGRGDTDVATVCVVNDDHVCHGCKEGAEVHFALAQRLLRPLALGDVADDGGVVTLIGHPPFGQGDLQRKRLPILPQSLRLQRPAKHLRFPAGLQLMHARQVSSDRRGPATAG